MGININIYNAVLFNIAWLLCVLGGDYIAVLTALVVILVHIRFISGHYFELALITQVVILGLIVDNLLIFLGILIPPEGLQLSPVWLVALWAVFATTLNHCFKWFQHHLLIAACVGAISGPLSYIAGARISDFSLAEPMLIAVISLSAVWAIIFPTCSWMARLYDKKQCAV